MSNRTARAKTPQSPARRGRRRLRPYPIDNGYAFWVEVDLGDGWMTAYRLMPHHTGQPVVAEVRVHPIPNPALPRPGWSEQPGDVPEGGMPGRALRALRLTDAMESFEDYLKHLKATRGEYFSDEAKMWLGMRPAERRRVRVGHRPGRAGRPDSFYATWAAAYVRRLHAGSRRPVQDLAASPPIRIEGYVSNGHSVSPETVRAILNRARARGLLTASPIGRAGGSLTPRAEEVLATPPHPNLADVVGS
jgi:hypothetical protein